MLEPEKQQFEIYLLKSNLEEIEKDLVGLRSELPALNAENEQKYKETMAAFRVAQSLNAEIERLKLENARLTAKRMQLKRQSDDISKSIEKARDTQCELTELVKQEEQEIELQIRQYEDSLEEIAERFRSTRDCYNEETMASATQEVTKTNIELANEVQKRKGMVDELVEQLNKLEPGIPEDILLTVGKEDLDSQIKKLTEEYEALLQKHDAILKKNNK